jgi:hypothetical protein
MPYVLLLEREDCAHDVAIHETLEKAEDDLRGHMAAVLEDNEGDTVVEDGKIVEKLVELADECARVYFVDDDNGGGGGEVVPFKRTPDGREVTAFSLRAAEAA